MARARNLPTILRRQIAGPDQQYLSGLEGLTVQTEDQIVLTRGYGHDPRVFYRAVVGQDDRVAPVLNKRYVNVLNGDYYVEPGLRRGMSPTADDLRAADMVAAQIRAMGTNEVKAEAQAYFSGGFESFTLGMLDAIFMGNAVAEVTWGIDGGECVALSAKPKSQRLFVYVKDDDSFSLRLSPWGTFEAQELPDRKFITYTWGSDTDPYGLGLASKLYWPVFFKRKGMSYWLLFLEKHGVPTVHAKTDSADTADRDKLFQAAKALQSESVVVTGIEEQLDLIETSRGAIQTGGYEALVREMNKAITIAIVGSELSTDISKGGSRAAATVHSAEEHELAIRDAADLSEGPYNQLSQWITYFNFAGDVATPQIKWRYPVQENLKEEADILTVLSGIGFTPSTKAGIDWVNDKFGSGADEPLFAYKETTDDAPPPAAEVDIVDGGDDNPFSQET